MTQPGTFVSDAVAFGRDQLIVTERDNGQGPAAAWKKAFVIDVPDRKPNLAKREIVDLLELNDKDGISLPGPPRRLRPRQPVQVPVPDRRGRAAALGQRAGVRQRHELRLDRPQPEPAGLQRLHHRQGARHQG